MVASCGTPASNRYVMFVQDSLHGSVPSDLRGWTRLAAQQTRAARKGHFDLTFSPLRATPWPARHRPVLLLLRRGRRRAPTKAGSWAANVGNEWEGIWYIYSADGLTWKKVADSERLSPAKGDPSAARSPGQSQPSAAPGRHALRPRRSAEPLPRPVQVLQSQGPRPGYGSRSAPTLPGWRGTSVRHH